MSASQLPTTLGANWKMNIPEIKSGMTDVDSVTSSALKIAIETLDMKGKEAIIAPPNTYLRDVIGVIQRFRQRAGTNNQVHTQVYAQDCSHEENGAHTGDISAQMLKNIGVDGVIVGHSERRTDHGETNEIVHSKAKAALDVGLKTIICVGETLEQRNAGETLDVIREQIEKSIPADANPENTIIAYEPVWAIGTGVSATPQDAQEATDFIASLPQAKNMRIQYGGSVKAGTVADYTALPNCHGALVGGESLKPAFVQLMANAHAADVAKAK